jgi:hypothetical protein
MRRVNVIDERNRQLNGERPLPYAIKLHLELDIESANLDESEMSILKRYGSMRKGIYRDIIVPGDITLHALHYVINRAFGWQNNHVHSFIPYETDYKRMVRNGKLTEWNRLAGMYFRLPTSDYPDTYWDDDYNGSMAVKTWLRRKYTGPYFYGGTSEYYMYCQEGVKELLSRYPAIDELEDKVDFAGGFNELIERLPIFDLLLTQGVEPDYDSWHFRNDSTLKQCENDQPCLMPPTTPILTELCYRYDYGDDWKVKIVATKMYATKEECVRTGYVIFALEAHRPVCVEAGGLPVCDDVGGIAGYCNMLKIIHGNDIEAKEAFKEKASAVGWKGKKQDTVFIV